MNFSFSGRWTRTAGLALVALLMTLSAAHAEDQPLMDYNVDVVTDYVARGQDLFVRRFDKDQDKHTAFNMAPALQPSLTFHGPSGLSLNLWGSFALADRADDNAKNFMGLGRDDELDYTLTFDWANRLGAFTAGFVYYTYFSSCYQGQNPSSLCNSKTSSTTVDPDAMIRWAAPFAEAIHPTLTHFANPVPGASYSTLAFSGGETVFWGLSLGEVAAGLQDVTAQLGVALGDAKVSVNGAYRPNPTLAGPYDKNGHYTVNGQQETYPAAIFWLTLSYGGSVSAR